MKQLFRKSRLLRFIHINFVLIRYWLLKNKLSRGERIRRALEELGPIFIKAGQIISTRRDLLPDDIAEELAKLQDQVPPFPGSEAKAIIESALHTQLAEVFLEFDLTALASASIAQVHTATLLDGRLVVVKVLRPHIRAMIERDLRLFATLATLVERYWVDGKHFKPQEIIEEMAHTLYDELDLMREGANASQLRRNFLHSPLLYIPEIYWEHCRTNVLVMERIDGIQVHNIQALKDANINMRALAERGIEIFFTQVFRDSFFHADMHPGNIFVARYKLEQPQYIAVDFGIVGSLSTKDKRYLAENLLAFFQRDYQRVAELHIASGWLPPDTRIDQLEGAIRAVCEPIFERPLKDVSFGKLLLRLLQTARRFNLNIQPQLLLLQKTLFNVEGVGRQLYPELDIWHVAAPFLERWLKSQMGVKGFIRKVRTNLPFWAEKFPEIPGLIYDVLNATRQQQAMDYFANNSVACAQSMQCSVTRATSLSPSVITPYKFSGCSVKMYTRIAKRYFIGGIGTALLFASCLVYFIYFMQPTTAKYLSSSGLELLRLVLASGIAGVVCLLVARFLL